MPVYLKRYFILFLFCGYYISFSQVTVYSTSFNAGHGWSLNSYNNLNVTTEGDTPNFWYVSDKESNKGVGNRGGANCGNVTLHVGSTSVGDLGAAYDAGGCTNFGFGPCASCLTNGLYCVTADKSAVSPNINTTGITGITLTFLYIHWGTTTLDNGEIIYSINGGTSWIKLSDVPKSGCCSGSASCLTGCTNNATCSSTHQGKWQQYSGALPATCQNITNLRIGFRWYNDDVSTTGRDPSLAVDDVTLVTPTLPVENSLLNAVPSSNQIELSWETYSERNNLGFDLERSVDGENFQKIAFLKGYGDSDVLRSYKFKDEEAGANLFYYYRFKQIDENGEFKYSNVAYASINDLTNVNVYPNPAKHILKMRFEVLKGNDFVIKLIDTKGNEVYNFAAKSEEGGNYNQLIDVKELPRGIYIYKIITYNKVVVGKVILAE
jgi:hypothetical protein